MTLCVVGEQKLTDFQFKVDNALFTATLSSLVCEGEGGEDEYAYLVAVTDGEGNIVMKEHSSDFQSSCDVYDRLTVVLGGAVVTKK